MAGISYSKAADGTEVGRWSGKSIRIGSKVTKEKQVYLGKVVDKEKLIFFSRTEGYFHFNMNTQEKEPIPDHDIPLFTPPLDMRLRERNVIISFGGSYFLHQLIYCIEYNVVLDCISLKNPHTMYALLQFYVLSDYADVDAFEWYQNNFARFLYPQANMVSQRISDFYVSFGSDNNFRAFFEKHIPYIISTTDDEYAIIIDSTGCQNACKIPITKISKHNNETNIEFRVVLVIQRSTGLPVYFEVVPGNTIDSTTLCRIIRLMGLYGLKITQVFGDAGYSCPSNIEKVVLCGSDLVMRLNPAYDTYKTVMQNHWAEMTVSTYDKEKDMRYRNRIIRVIQVSTVIGNDSDGNEVNGFVYLCRDMQAYHSKSDHFMSYHGKECKNIEEIYDVCEQFGLFAIVTKYDYSKEDIIPYYYQRQGIEQFFDFAKNYGKMMPVRNHNMDTIKGHMLMSFIATLLLVVIKNKMNLLDIPYIAIPKKLQDSLSQNEEKLTVEIEGEAECVVEQEPIQSVFVASPSSLFFSLNFVGADVFEHQKDGNNQIVPSVPYKDANDYFKAFGIPCPEAVLIKPDGSLQMILVPKKKITCCKSKVFAVRPYSSIEMIEKQKPKNKTQKSEDDKQTGEKGKDQDKKQKEESAENASTANESETEQATASKQKTGRPRGSKNKKTLEREAEMGGQEVILIKRGRGRPLGSKDKQPRIRRWKKRPNNTDE